MTDTQQSSLAATADGQRMVVGGDGSDSYITALRWAASLTRVLGCRLDAIMAWQYPTDFGYGWVGPPVQWNPAVDAEKSLGAALLQAAEHATCPVLVAHGDAAAPDGPAQP